MGRSNTTRRGPLPAPEVRADDSSQTRFSGLVPLIRFMDGHLKLPQRLKGVVRYKGRRRKYGVHLVLFAFIVGTLAGVQRLAHIEWLKGDAVVLKFLRLPSWPVRKVFTSALAWLSEESRGRLQDLVTTTGLWSAQGERDVVLDADSSVLVSFGEQEGAKFGYCGKGRNRRRHHPLVGSIACSRAVVIAKYRDGSAIAANEIIEFFAEMVQRVRQGLGDVSITLRADSGFWSKAVGHWLLEETLPFVFAMPLRAGLKLMLAKAEWEELDGEPDIQVATLPGDQVGIDARLRIIAVRRFVHDKKAPPQGKKISWDPNWRYQATVTCLDWEPVDVWRFYNDRADCERIFKVAKHALGMSWLVGHEFRVNTVAFLLRMVAYNADLLFQRHIEQRAREERRPRRCIGLQARQNRFYNGSGRLLLEHNRWVLRVSPNKEVKRLWAYYAPELLAVA